MSRQSSVMGFIEKERAEGKTDKQIKHDLLDAGWHMDIIKHAMGELKKDHPIAKSTPEKRLNPSVNQLIGLGLVIFASLVLLAIYI